MRGRKFENIPWADNKSGKKRMHVKKGDKVFVISGNDRQKEGDEPREVLSVDAVNGTVVVQGVNMRWKHQKRSQQNPKGGRVQLEMPIAASKVLLFSEKLGKGTRTKIQLINGKKARVFTTTMGASQDLLNEGVRRMIVNASFWALGMEDKIPAQATVDIVGDYKPTRFSFKGYVKGVKPEDHAWKK